MGKVWKWFKLICVIAPRLLFSYWVYFRKYARHPERYPLELRYKRVRKFVLFLCRHMHIDLDLRGLEHLNDGKTKVIIPNHTGITEPLMLIALSEKPLSFISKKENLKAPFFSKILAAIDSVFLDRSDPLSALRQFRATAKKMKETGLSYVVFPEGTRNRKPLEVDLLPFHTGSFKLPLLAESELLILAQFGAWRPLDGKKNYRSYPLQFHFQKPWDYGFYKDLKTQQIEKQVIDTFKVLLPAMKEADAEFFEKNLHRKKAKKWWKEPKVEAILPKK